jgi:large subunit ribosomal protein L9
MKVILRSNVDNVGRAGDVKEVKNGFGRNFLIPQGLAVPATPAALKEWEKGKDKRARLVEAEVKTAKALAEKLTGVSLSFIMPAGAEGKLFGSVGKTSILKSLSASGFEVNKDALKLESAIKTVGEHEIELKLQPEVSAKIKVVVVARE